MAGDRVSDAQQFMPIVTKGGAFQLDLSQCLSRATIKAFDLDLDPPSANDVVISIAVAKVRKVQ